MYLMVDVVTNHMGYNGCGNCVNYGQLKPFDNSGYYHPFCEINYNDDNSVRTCWEGDNKVSLPDLRTEDSGIRNTFNEWIRDLVSKYSIDGMRIDSVKHVEKDFWPGFLQAAGIYGIGEVSLVTTATSTPSSICGILADLASAPDRFSTVTQPSMATGRIT